jgi:hypothetical protein
MNETSKTRRNVTGKFVQIVSSVVSASRKNNSNNDELSLRINLSLMIPYFPLQIYTGISNKVVGVLLRARKHKFVDFEGETLFQASSLKW